MIDTSRYILLLIGCCLAVTALADDAPEDRSRPTFASIDTNQDMLLSADELKAFKESRRGDCERRPKGRNWDQSRFEGADSDGDGYVNELEFDALQEQMREERRERRRGRRLHRSESEGTEF